MAYLFDCFNFWWDVEWEFFVCFFKSIFPIDFACLLFIDDVRGIYFWRHPCIRPSIPSFCPSVHTFLVRKHISVPIYQIWIILCTIDKYHVLLISNKFRQNRPFNTWVMALVLVKAIIMQNLYQLFCVMIFTFHQSYYILVKSSNRQRMFLPIFGKAIRTISILFAFPNRPVYQSSITEIG